MWTPKAVVSRDPFGTSDSFEGADVRCPAHLRDSSTDASGSRGYAGHVGYPIRLGGFLVGVEGLALLRHAFGEDIAARARRVAEIRELLGDDEPDSALDDPIGGEEYDLDDGYRVWSATYDQPLRLFPIESPPVHRLIDSMTPGIVVDAACGTGRHSGHLVEAGHTVIGIDRSPAMLDHARRNVPRASFRPGELTALPVEDAAADAVVCALALVHVADLDSVFREFARVVKPGGRLIVSDVHPMLVALGWQAQFPSGSDGRGFIRLRQHLLSDYIGAGVRNDFTVAACAEPPLTAEAARTPTAGRIPEASEQAFAGLPAVVVWAFDRA